MQLLSGDMFVRTATRRNKDGSAVRYLQLVHNEWDPASKTAKMRVLHNFAPATKSTKAATDGRPGRLARRLDPGRRARLPDRGRCSQGRGASAGPGLRDQ